MLENINFTYGRSDTLKNINLKIPARTTVAIVGESGAGKSTLIDLVTGTLPPTSGIISVDGHSFSELDMNFYRSKIGYVTQESVMFDDTIENNVTLWRATLEGGVDERLKTALDQANCSSFVVGLPAGVKESVGDKGVKLSGGQRQRLSIARELFKEPNLLVLDEATSALDSESERLVQQSIEALRGKMTVLIVAHRFSTIKHCDLICVMKEGELLELGTFDELVARNGTFKRMCDMQSLQ